MFDFIIRSVKCNFGADKEYYRFINNMFGFVPNNIELYKVALIHKSASQSIGGHHINNERLEYLGDAVIEAITSEYLFIRYPDRDEGFLTQMRSKIVSRQALNEMATIIGLDKYIICNGGAISQQKNIYGDAFEAMIGAIYLDKGYDFVNRLLINDIFSRHKSMDDLPYEENDYKSRLIEWCQKNRHTIEFKTEKGYNRKNSAPIFYTKAIIDGIEVGHGSGDSKKSAEQKASCSVSREFTDKECARLLDRYDWLMTHKTEEAQTLKAAKSRGENKKADKERKEDKRPKAAKEEAPKVQQQQPEAEPVQAPEPEVIQEQQPKKRRSSRRKKTTEAAEIQNNTEQPAVSAEAPQQPKVPAAEDSRPAATESTEEAAAPAKKRRPRRKKSDANAEPAPEAANTAETNQEAQQPAEQSAEQPARKRRPRRKKQDSAAAAESAQAEPNAEE